MNQMERKRLEVLEVLVNGSQIGEIEMTFNGHAKVVSGGVIVPLGEYSHSGEVIMKAYEETRKKFPDGRIRIKYIG